MFNKTMAADNAVYCGLSTLAYIIKVAAVTVSILIILRYVCD